MPPEAAAPPLSAIRVLDLTTARCEIAGRILADLGAEVLKIEPPEGGDSRRMPPFEDGREGDTDGSLYWAAYGRGKRSVVLDLASAEGQAQLRALAAGADVLLESFEPGHLAGLGLGYEDLRALNPALIYASLTPYGQSGPDAHSPATDLTIEAAGGLLSLTGDGDRAPVPVGYPQAGLHGGAQAAADAVVALCERDRSGLGQYLDVSMQACMVWTTMDANGFPPNTGSDKPGFGDDSRRAPASARAGPRTAAHDRGGRRPHARHDGRQPASAHRGQRDHEVDARGRGRAARAPPVDRLGALAGGLPRPRRRAGAHPPGERGNPARGRLPPHEDEARAARARRRERGALRADRHRGRSAGGPAARGSRLLDGDRRPAASRAVRAAQPHAAARRAPRARPRRGERAVRRAA